MDDQNNKISVKAGKIIINLETIMPNMAIRNHVQMVVYLIILCKPLI